jgi:hypothetical protein
MGLLGSGPLWVYYVSESFKNGVFNKDIFLVLHFISSFMSFGQL